MQANPLGGANLQFCQYFWRKTSGRSRCRFSQSKFFIFMQFSAKIVTNNSLAQPSGVDAPFLPSGVDAPRPSLWGWRPPSFPLGLTPSSLPSGKSWVFHWKQHEIEKKSWSWDQGVEQRGKGAPYWFATNIPTLYRISLLELGGVRDTSVLTAHFYVRFIFWGKVSKNWKMQVSRLIPFRIPTKRLFSEYKQKIEIFFPQ